METVKDVMDLEIKNFANSTQELLDDCVFVFDQIEKKIEVCQNATKEMIKQLKEKLIFSNKPNVLNNLQQNLLLNGVSIVKHAESILFAAIFKDYYKIGNEIGLALNELLFVKRALTQLDIDAYYFTEGFIGSTALTTQIDWNKLYEEMIGYGEIILVPVKQAMNNLGTEVTTNEIILATIQSTTSTLKRGIKHLSDSNTLNAVIYKSIEQTDTCLRNVTVG